MGVEGAGTFAGGLVGDDLDLAFLLDHLVFQQALVDRAELLHRKIAIVDAPPAVMRQRKDHGRQGSVRQIDPFQKRAALGSNRPPL